MLTFYNFKLATTKYKFNFKNTAIIYLYKLLMINNIYIEITYIKMNKTICFNNNNNNIIRLNLINRSFNICLPIYINYLLYNNTINTYLYKLFTFIIIPLIPFSSIQLSTATGTPIIHHMAIFLYTSTTTTTADSSRQQQFQLLS